MAEKTIGQLWYTWSTIGLDSISVGYRVRAASPSLSNLQSNRYNSMARYLQYQLPQGIDSNSVSPEQAPISFTFAKNEYGKLLAHKVYVGRDGVGRAGNHFAHLLAYLPEDFSARDAIELWGSPLWKRNDVPQEVQSTQLGELSRDDLANKIVKQRFHFATVEQHLGILIKAFLSSASLRSQVQITGSSENILKLLWGLTHSIPKTLLSDITFATYECEPAKSHESIVGIINSHELLHPDATETTVDISPPRQLSTDISVDEYVSYAVRCLIESDDGQSAKLNGIVNQAEKRNITTVKAFLELFRKLTVRDKLTQLIDDLRTALLQSNWSAMSQLCHKFTLHYPPATHKNAWNILFRTFSKEEALCQQLMKQRAACEWLFSGLVLAAPEMIDHLNPWLSGSWSNLEVFLSLDLPAAWHVEAIIATLLSPKWVQTQSTALIEKYEPVFAEALQLLASEAEEVCIETLLDFFSPWEPDNVLKNQLCTQLINAENTNPETRRQLINLTRSNTVLAPQVEDHSTVQSPRSSSQVTGQDVNFKRAVTDLLTSTFQLMKQILSKRSNRRFFFLLCIVILLLCTYPLLYYIGTTHPSPAAQATYMALGKSTVTFQGTQIAQKNMQATVQAESGNDGDNILSYSLTEKQVQNSTQFTIYVILQNTGQSTWSDSRGYHLACVPPTGTSGDPDCQHAIFSNFMGDKVLPGHTYVLSITLILPAPKCHHIRLGLVGHDGHFIISQGNNSLQRVNFSDQTGCPM